MEELKKRYNELLDREKKAELYFDNPAIPDEEKEKFIPAFNNIIIELSKLINKYKADTGENLPEEIVFNGFK